MACASRGTGIVSWVDLVICWSAVSWGAILASEAAGLLCRSAVALWIGNSVTSPLSSVVAEAPSLFKLEVEAAGDKYVGVSVVGWLDGLGVGGC